MVELQWMGRVGRHQICIKQGPGVPSAVSGWVLMTVHT